MKNKILYCFLFLSLNTAFSQWINQSYNLTPTIYIEQIVFLNNSTGFFAGLSGKILKTTNSGNNWNMVILSTVIDIFGIDFKNETTGMLVGTLNSVKYCFKTTNSGNNWIQVNTPNNKGFNGIRFLGQNQVICSGDSGVIYKSTNLGTNWNLTQCPTFEDLGRVFVVDSLRCFVTGNNGVFLRSSDGGNNWDLLSLNSTNYFGSISFVNANTGYVASTFVPMVKKTTNGGLFWTTLYTGPTPLEQISSVFFPSVNTGYLTSYYNTGQGYQEVILKTTNAGINWRNVTSTNRLAPLRASFFLFNDTGWVAGDAGFILKTTNGGLTYINGEVETVSDYKLKQNYPNPFNPNTVISYKLSVARNVTLTVYDVNGRLVKQLVNEKQNAGSYEVNFDGSGLPSGTYVYRITAGNYSETKKMLLVK